MQIKTGILAFAGLIIAVAIPVYVFAQSASCHYACCYGSTGSTSNCPVGDYCDNGGTMFASCQIPTSQNAPTNPTNPSPTNPTSPTTGSPSSGGLCITSAPPTSNTNAPFYTQLQNACQAKFGSTWAGCVATAGSAGPTNCNYGAGNTALAFSCGMPESGQGTTGYCQPGGSTNCITPLTSVQMAAALANVTCPSTDATSSIAAPGPNITVAASCVSATPPPLPPASSDTSAADLSNYVAQACTAYYSPIAEACESNSLWLTNGVCTHYPYPQLAYNCGEPLMGASEYTAASYPSMTKAQMAAQLEPLTLDGYVGTACGELWSGPQASNSNYGNNEGNSVYVYADPQLAYNCDMPLAGAGSDNGLLGTGDDPTMTYAQMATAFEALSCSGNTNTGTGTTGSTGTTGTTGGGTTTTGSTGTGSVETIVNGYRNANPSGTTTSNAGGSGVTAGTSGSTNLNDQTILTLLTNILGDLANITSDATSLTTAQGQDILNNVKNATNQITQFLQNL